MGGCYQAKRKESKCQVLTAEKVDETGDRLELSPQKYLIRLAHYI
jgi:hypothetical protein